MSDDGASSDGERPGSDCDVQHPYIGSLSQTPRVTPFTRNDYPSKLGGQPCWLNPQSLPSSSAPDGLVCPQCSVRMTLLLQVYAPRGELNDAAFHRSLSVFVCRRTECSAGQKGNAVRVLRTQLPRQNPFYPFNFDAGPLDCTALEAQTCAVCGLAAPHRCGGCKTVFYSSAECQAIDWKLGHKKVCTAVVDKVDDALLSALQTKRAKFLIPECEILIRPAASSDDDEYATSDLPVQVAQPTFQDANPDELPEDLFKAPTTDAVFLKFQTAIERDPDQILRYGASKPLWAHSKGQVAEVPECSNCHAPRDFEMQIMPQLLYLIGQRGGGEEKKYGEYTASGMGTSACWATIAIYTCSKMCARDQDHAHWGAYVEEFAWVQIEDYDR